MNDQHGKRGKVQYMTVAKMIQLLEQSPANAIVLVREGSELHEVEAMQHQVFTGYSPGTNAAVVLMHAGSRRQTAFSSFADARMAAANELVLQEAGIGRPL